CELVGALGVPSADPDGGRIAEEDAHARDLGELSVDPSKDRIDVRPLAARFEIDAEAAFVAGTAERSTAAARRHHSPHRGILLDHRGNTLQPVNHRLEADPLNRLDRAED